MLETLLLLWALLIRQRLIYHWLPPALFRLCRRGSSLPHQAGPIYDGRAQARSDHQRGGGAAANSRSALSSQASARPVPASGGGPGRKPTVSRGRGSTPEGHRGSRSPAGERSFSPAPGKGRSAEAGQRSVLALARPKFGPAGVPSPCAAAARGEVPRQDTQGATPRPQATPVLHAAPSSRAAQPGRGQAGGRGAPAAAPQLVISRIRFTGESDGATPMPRVRCTHLSQASLLFRFGSLTAPLSVSLDGPARGQLPRVHASRSHPRARGRSRHVDVHTRDQDK
ncbi:hypothetical protein NDU88_006716 [Pleurodeles waltl]|uniref:Uncharacterized protein n=1 Tax=Pleurodeles waltl TaxID=8319 RepID=A0AAV7QII9_PLEWA|nr:hypothetical protein NDU88_006716 [Pleurodeles waltl]